MQNLVVLTGRLGADPEVKETMKGDTMASLSLATNEKYKVGDDWKEKTQWHSVKIFNPNIAKSIGSYMKKGDLVHVQGQVEYRAYEVAGEKKYVTEIVIPRFRGVVQLIPTQKSNNKPPQAHDEGPISQAKREIDEANIPF